MTDTVTVAVQINGKMRGKIVVPMDSAEEAVLDAALADDAVGRHLDGKEIRKKIYVRNRILNLVVG